MNFSGTITPAEASTPQRWQDWARSHWPLVVGFLALLVPTIVQLGRESWSTELGAHGPIVLATGIWLFTQLDRARLREVMAPASGPWFILAFLVALPIYIFGRAYDFISLESAGVYFIFLAVAYQLIGARAMAENFFPFLYLGFLVPPPGWLVDKVTMPLQNFISYVITHGLQFFDYPVIRHGVTLYIAQYQLLVEQACSGMNSIVGLTAISLFYIYIMHKSSWRYALFLALLILPIAVFANMVRVLCLVLLTYYQGDAAAQGFLHVTTGIVLFAFALLTIFGVDALIQRFFLSRKVART